MGNGNAKTLIESWNGVAWSVVPSPSPAAGRTLYGVSCLSANWCVAVGQFADGTTARATAPGFRTLVESGTAPPGRSRRARTAEPDRDPAQAIPGAARVPASAPPEVLLRSSVSKESTAAKAPIRHDYCDGVREVSERRGHRRRRDRSATRTTDPKFPVERSRYAPGRGREAR
jgi:hypothetical protein